MQTSVFNTVVKQRCEKIENVLARKAGEYASTDDRLHNFKAAARALGTTPEAALWGMYMKHFVSVQDAVLDPEFKPTKEWIDEKLGDSVNYHILLEGVMIEKLPAPATNTQAKKEEEPEAHVVRSNDDIVTDQKACAALWNENEAKHASTPYDYMKTQKDKE